MSSTVNAYQRLNNRKDLNEAVWVSYCLVSDNQCLSMAYYQVDTSQVGYGLADPFAFSKSQESMHRHPNDKPFLLTKSMISHLVA